MGRRYSFIILFLAVLAPLSWWSEHVQSFPAQTSASRLEATESELAQRRELIEALDRLAAYEHYYRSVYGHFTRRLSRLGFPLPVELTDLYDVRVTEAARGRLVITATSERDGQIQDRVSIDQDYRVSANFPIPSPRADYLKTLALRQLRVLRDAPVGKPVSLIEEQNAFGGYFAYESHEDPRGQRVSSAVGIRAPVLGMHLELGPQDSELVDSATTGQKSGSGTMSTLEEAYLAQRIFKGEMGRYAKSWSELAKIATFRFEDKAQFGHESQVPFGDPAQALEVEGETQESKRSPSSDIQPIEIEPVSNSSP